MSLNPKDSSVSDINNLKTEIILHRRIDHPNIIKFHDYFVFEQNVYIMLDYAEHGNLYSYIQKKKVLLESEIHKFFVQTCQALDYLHINNIMHRDIKPENLLIDKNNNIKLCDFGWSAQNINDKRYFFFRIFVFLFDYQHYFFLF